MSTARVERNKLSIHSDALGCDLHAAMLPIVAVAAAYADEPFCARARAHLDRVWNSYEFPGSDIGSMWDALWKLEGSLLEPFHCPLDLCNPMVVALSILARDAGGRRNERGRILLMNHGVKAAWSGVEIDGEFVRPFRCRDFRARCRMIDDGRPAVPLAVDLDQLATASLTPVKASIQTGSPEPSLLIELPASSFGAALPHLKPSLHFGHGFTLPQRAGRESQCVWAKTAPSEPAPEIAPVAGELRRDPRTTAGNLLTMPLPSTLMLRLAALPGAKRFIVRVPCEGTTAGEHEVTFSRTVIGSLDASGVRAAVLPWEGWTCPSSEWMPFAPFAPSQHEDHRRKEEPTLSRDFSPPPGTFDALVDLLLDLSLPLPGPNPEAPQGPAAKRRVRPMSNLGTALLRMKTKIDGQRSERRSLFNLG